MLLVQAIDGSWFANHHFRVSRLKYPLEKGRAKVVGSPGNRGDLVAAMPADLAAVCDLVEVRLDLMGPAMEPADWRRLPGVPLLFTARRGDEGGAGNLSAEARMDLLLAAAPDAAWVDVEVASIPEMKPLLNRLAGMGVPWIASYHDFRALPPTSLLEDAARRAKEAGASVFKAAAWLSSPADLARLAEFQMADHGLLVATMGMGPLAPVSRLLCAQCGSVLNYGYLGNTPTAPGQWDCALLKKAIAALAPFPTAAC